MGGGAEELVDVVKPKSPDADGDAPKRKIGGQPGHPKHDREPFSPEEIAKSHTHTLDACPRCGGGLRPNGELARLVQQVDVPEIPLTIERGGLVGPNLMTLIAFLKGNCHASYSTIRTFLRDVVGVEVARSTLDKTVKKMSAALERTYEELAVVLPFEDV